MKHSLSVEGIVKRSVPFAGLYDSGGFAEKGRIGVPKGLVLTLKARQERQNNGELQLYYRIHSGEMPKYMELTDFFPEGRNPNFARYRRVYDLDEKCRILIPPDDWGKVGIEEHKPVVFWGSGNKIFVYKPDDYETYRNTSYLSLDAITNLMIRVKERVTLPSVK